MSVLELKDGVKWQAWVYPASALRECPVCHWHGVPTFRNGQIQRECPSCGRPVIRR